MTIRSVLCATALAACLTALCAGHATAQSAPTVAPTPPVILPLPPIAPRPDSLRPRRAAVPPQDPPSLGHTGAALRSMTPTAASLPSASVAPVAPADATGRCRDGTYLTSAPSEVACAQQGGLAVIFPASLTRSPRP